MIFPITSTVKHCKKFATHVGGSLRSLGHPLLRLASNSSDGAVLHLPGLTRNASRSTFTKQSRSIWVQRAIKITVCATLTLTIHEVYKMEQDRRVRAARRNHEAEIWSKLSPHFDPNDYHQCRARIPEFLEFYGPEVSASYERAMRGLQPQYEPFFKSVACAFCRQMRAILTTYRSPTDDGASKHLDDALVTFQQRVYHALMTPRRGIYDRDIVRFFQRSAQLQAQAKAGLNYRVIR
ncbi:hypothetical protein BV22DRAFT_1030410 [Leucogyrophana mollusca]|uniref:Uncharacterized protein n=1 Tax=Leucogyrophana mollusca TaxID=85980 RepID=A0ACB8BUY8_9AGAM|nr:hypothetical protein BV22DRAFT_1030410 [Leucogyrophana mollusca]